MIQEDMARVRAQFLAEQQLIDHQRTLRVLECLAQCLDRDAVVSPQRAQDVRLNEIPE